MKRLIASKRATCEDCEHGKFESSYTLFQGNENEFECEFDWDNLPDEKKVEMKLCNEDVEEVMEKAFLGEADKCPGFSPYMFEECGGCKKPLNKPKHEIDYFSYHPYADVGIPACSQECKNTIDERIKKNVEEDQRIEIEEEYSKKRRRYIGDDDHI